MVWEVAQGRLVKQFAANIGGTTLRTMGVACHRHSKRYDYDREKREGVNLQA